MVKNRGMKRKREKTDKNVIETEAEQLPPLKRLSEDPVPVRTKWINKQRVLIFASRGISHRDRHLMEDVKKLMPHHKAESKMERSKTLSVINEICEIKNCNKVMMFEGRKKKDLYIWMSNVPNGPSIKFLVENIHTMAELKMTGNCLRGSRPLLSFDPSFNEKPHYSLIKELLTQIFGIPKHHPKSQPFNDHVYTFSVLDNRIWFRNFQILSEDGALAEIGPRFVLNPVKMFTGSFGGVALWDNTNYISPSKYRQEIQKRANYKYINRVQQKVMYEATRPENSYKLTPLNDIFEGDPIEKAKEIIQPDDEDDDNAGNSNVDEDTTEEKMVMTNTLKKKKKKTIKKKKVIVSKKVKKAKIKIQNIL